MSQKELIELYKELNEKYEPDYTSASKFFKKHKEHNSLIQDGKANELNFFSNTMVKYKEVSKPKRKEDFKSGSGSRYWYSKKGVIRGSDHWGNRVYNCDWPLERKDGKTCYGTSAFATKTFSKELFGFAKWEDFILKPQLFEINNKEVLTTFNNKIGHDIVIVGKKKYQAIPTIVWKKLKD